MSSVCPMCAGVIPEGDINRAKGAAYCPHCGSYISVSRLLAEVVPVARDLTHARPPGAPPRGAWRRDEGGAVVVGARLGNLAVTLFFLLFAAFWNSVVWFLVTMLVKEALHPGTTHTANGRPAPVAFLALLLTPFVLVGLGTAGTVLLNLFGHCQVTIRGGQAAVFTGIGPVGWSRRFAVSEVKAVSVRPAGWSIGGSRHSGYSSWQASAVAVFTSSKRYRFGSLLTDDRRNFVVASLCDAFGCQESASDSDDPRITAAIAGTSTGDPPQGAWNRSDGSGTVVGASAHSLKSFFAVLAIALFWNGIAGFFVIAAAAAIMNNLGYVVPSWMPNPQWRGHKPISMPEALGLGAFLLPFVVIGILMLVGAVFSLFGRAEVTIRDGQGLVFTGIGAVGRRRRFGATDVTRVDLRLVRWARASGDDPPSSKDIVIEGSRTIRFGVALPVERKLFVVAALRKALGV